MAMEATRTLADELDHSLSALWRTLGRAAHGELSRTAASVLATLRDAGPARITALADGEAVAQPSMTTLVSRLERDGLVERASDPTDARAVLVRITDRGRERLEARRRVRTARLEERLRGLDPGERAAIAAALPALDRLGDRGLP
jgi:DNA-binding MarR family transcriptional regulator